MKANEILMGIANDVKGSLIEEPANIILDLCSIESVVDLKASLFKRHNLRELLNIYSDAPDFNRDMYTFARGLIHIVDNSVSVLFVCRVYTNLRNDFGDAMKLLPENLTEDFVEGLEAFGRASYDVKHADEFFKDAARHFFKIYYSEEFIPKAAMDAVNRCVDRLAQLIDQLVPPMDEQGHRILFEKDKLDGYMDIFSACFKKKAETE